MWKSIAVGLITAVVAGAACALGMRQCGRPQLSAGAGLLVGTICGAVLAIFVDGFGE